MTTINKSIGFNVADGIPESAKEKLRNILERSYNEFEKQDVSGLIDREYSEFSFSGELEVDVSRGRFSGEYLKLALSNVGSGRVSRGVGGCYVASSYYGEIVEIAILEECTELFTWFERNFDNELDDRTFYILSSIASESFEGYEKKDYFFEYVFDTYESFEFVKPKYRTIERVVSNNGVERTVSVVEKIVDKPVEEESLPDRNWRLYMPKELAS